MKKHKGQKVVYRDGKMFYMMYRFFMWINTALSIASLGAVIAGHWHHSATLVITAGMAYQFYTESKRERNQQPVTSNQL